MNNDELKLTEYIHSITEENISLRNENNKLWEQKLDYIDRISKAINYIQSYDIALEDIAEYEYHLLEILRSKE